MSPFDPDGLRLATTGGPVGGRKVELNVMRERRERRFIPPMPYQWFLRACRLPGKAAILAAVLWYLHKLRRENPVRLTQVTLNDFGVSRQAKYRGLRHLEQAGLITVNRRNRKNPEVTLVPTSNGWANGGPDTHGQL